MPRMDYVLAIPQARGELITSLAPTAQAITATNSHSRIGGRQGLLPSYSKAHHTLYIRRPAVPTLRETRLLNLTDSWKTPLIKKATTACDFAVKL